MQYRPLLITWLALFVFALPATGDWKDDIGYTRLVNELTSAGEDVPSGAGITVSHVEGHDDDGDYAPNIDNPQFDYKDFTFRSGPSGVSSHATTVGLYFYGNTGSIAPGIDTIDNWKASDWLGVGFLRVSSFDPNSEARQIQNHSWIADYADDAEATDAIRRFDYTIHQDNYVAVAGLNNSSSTTLPDVLAHSYNAIAVGRTDGEHSRGLTRFDAAGRVKPDIVVPLGATSWGTPIVGASAAMLLEMVDDDSSLSDAGNSEAVKAILMAGATKGEFSTWDRTHTRPLDDVYGAGELNIRRSYRTLAAGEQEASGSTLVDAMGWDFDAVAASANATYFFEIAEPNFLRESSIVLSWNREITDSNPSMAIFNPSISLAELDLELWTADGFALDERLDYSASTVDNVEHIWVEDLSAGRYAMRVLAGATGGDYALAWYSRELARGDMNADGNVDTLDVTALVKALLHDEATFETFYPDESYWAADVNADGNVDALDITPFVNLLTGGGAALAPVPEPATMTFMALAALALPRRRPDG